MRPARFHSRLTVLATVAAAVLLAACAPPPPAKDTSPPNGEPNDHGWFQGGYQWNGDFADPHVVRVGSTYYAYATATGGRYLPTLASTDLKTWFIHPYWSTAGPPGARGYNVNTDPQIPIEIRQSPMNDWDKYNHNDALVRTASWGLPTSGHPWINRDLWAPGVIQIGSTWFAYSAVRVSWTSDDPTGRFCLTVASGPSPLGPFRDTTGGPIQCQPADRDPGGSLDPFPYYNPLDGRHYLLWKAMGKVGVRESALMSVEIGADGRPVPGAPWTKLLETDRSLGWEGNTIENPGMVFWNGVTYLFYSANDWRTDAYMMGYAICYQGPVARCLRPQPGPIIAGSPGISGPGGSGPFVTADGQLRLAYASYWPGENRSPLPRRLRISRIVPNPENPHKLLAGGDV